MNVKQPINIFWFRRDLRLHDNAGLYHALKSGTPVLPVFIFDKNILDELEEKHDRRVAFIHKTLVELQAELVRRGSSLEVHYGLPNKVFEGILDAYQVKAVFTNHDYEPYASERDDAVKRILASKNCSLHTFKDQVIFDKDEIVKSDSTPYTVFTPYSRKWLEKLNDFYSTSYPSEKYLDNILTLPAKLMPTLKSMGFRECDDNFPPITVNQELIKDYNKQRDYPALEGTTRLGVHLRFGTISIRDLVRDALSLNSTFLKELIWREFYQMILWHFPKVGRGKAFREQYESIKWRNNEEEFKRWCEGTTGYPIVDAGMRQLNTTGFMHNRVRMVVASFLAKHLLIDWRWGEAYFAQKLLDFDLAANNGNWQWAAGSGCDAAPYFRIFNPYLQTKRFDPKLKYVRKWVPEFEEFSYPKPIVDHEFARKRCLEVYAKALTVS